MGDLLNHPVWGTLFVASLIFTFPPMLIGLAVGFLGYPDIGIGLIMGGGLWTLAWLWLVEYDIV